jgi:cytochrome P450
MEELGSLGPDPDLAAITRLPYLTAVVNEVLRPRPMVPLVPRRLKAPLTLKGYELPVGMGLGLSIPLAHTNPDVYPNPHEFRPERFLERTFSPFEYIPYGGGVRRCLGAAFADYEMKLVLATLLPRYEFELVRKSLTMGPHTGVRAWIKKRS